MTTAERIYDYTTRSGAETRFSADIAEHVEACVRFANEGASAPRPLDPTDLWSVGPALTIVRDSYVRSSGRDWCDPGSATTCRTRDPHEAVRLLSAAREHRAMNGFRYAEVRCDGARLLYVDRRGEIRSEVAS